MWRAYDNLVAILTSAGLAITVIKYEVDMASLNRFY